MNNTKMLSLFSLALLISNLFAANPLRRSAAIAARAAVARTAHQPARVVSVASSHARQQSTIPRAPLCTGSSQQESKKKIVSRNLDFYRTLCALEDTHAIHPSTLKSHIKQQKARYAYNIIEYLEQRLNEIEREQNTTSNKKLLRALRVESHFVSEQLAFLRDGLKTSYNLNYYVDGIL